MTNPLDNILAEWPAQDLIDYINNYTHDETMRCRLLLAALLLRSAPKGKQDE